MATRQPGERRSASQIIGRATLFSAALVALFGIIGVLIALVKSVPSTAATIGFAAALAVFFNVLSWLECELLPRAFPRFQGGAMVAAFVLKLLIILAMFELMRDVGWLDRRVFVIAFAVGVVSTLVMNSIVVMCEDGPAIGTDQN